MTTSVTEHEQGALRFSAALVRDGARGRFGALEVALLHVAGAVSARLLAQVAGLAEHTRVTLTDGPYAGDAGYVSGPAWALDDER